MIKEIDVMKEDGKKKYIELEEVKNLKKRDEKFKNEVPLLILQSPNQFLGMIYNKSINQHLNINQQIDEIFKLVNVNKQNFKDYRPYISSISSEYVKVLYEKFYNIITHLLTIEFVLYCRSFLFFF
jgi:hypothetical protein